MQLPCGFEIVMYTTFFYSLSNICSKTKYLLGLEIISAFNVKLGTFITGDRVSSVGVAARYGLDGSEFESRWGRDFSDLSRPSPRPT